jgi:hypothetical protein
MLIPPPPALYLYLGKQKTLALYLEKKKDNGDQ